MTQRTCLLFDIDRTLMDGDGAGRAALRRAFALEPGGGEALDSVAFHGRTDGWTLRQVARSAGLSLERLGARFANDYPGLLREELAAREPWVLPGVVALMQALQARDDVAFCIGTGNSRDAAFMKLARVGLDAYFDGGGFGDRHEHRADMLRDAITFVGWQPGERLVVIGDSEHDVAAAHDVDAIAVGVATGNLSEAQLTDVGADVTLRDLDDLRRTLDALLGAR